MGSGLRSSYLASVGIWVVSLIGYCLLQTVANALSVHAQDVLLYALPMLQAFTVIVALRVGPPMRLVFRTLVAGVAAYLFGRLYLSYFAEVIVQTLHVWDRHEGNLQPMMAFSGFLGLVGVLASVVSAAFVDRRRVPRQP